jgi:hypothetical protein
MAEIKNNFLGAKMNRDIDDRLLQPNEYRYALNLEVNRSENSDVGTLQNVLGNSLAVDFNTLTGSTGLECIGIYTDNSKNNIYLLLTNNNIPTYNKDAKNFIYVYNSLDLTSTKLVSGAFLNFSTLNPVLGINLIDDLLFFTDNRNQPRRINVKNAASSSTYYQYEEQISVAKINPSHAMELFRLSTLSGVPVGTYESSMLDVVSPKLPNGTTNNPYYNSSYAGDPTYLEDKYMRFSYRYKFEDGEYSIMAPFTQIIYIPKQDGYFLYDNTTTPTTDNEADTYRSTIVKFMRNKVNDVFLQIKLPCAENQLNSRYKVSYIEILCKDANEIAINAVDLIPVDSTFDTSSTVYIYEYQSKKPFKTLPERDLIRVNDRVPIKALGQEIVSNRIVYSNYQDKFYYPKYLDYNVGYGTKYGFGFTNGTGTSIVEYPNHSVKQNRNYQVGIILCDKFGRESGVILSNKLTSESSNTFVASSLYAPYLTSSDTTTTKISYWPGNSLKVLFNNVISPTDPDLVLGWPGLYNGDTSSASYNPLGWYSYKIVVKQTEQEYYNVYLPGTMSSYPTNTLLEIGKTSHVVLINDNINKVPRDLTEVGPSQVQFRSSVVLYPRVNNNSTAYKNEMYYPKTSYSIVSTIANNNSLFFNTTVTLTNEFLNFYQINSNPLIARISTPERLGVIPSSTTTPNVINLSVYETKPVDSKLDIYWETSSSGIISELNDAIQNGATFTLKDIVGWNFNLTEAQGDATNGTVTTASPYFHFTNIADATIEPNSVVLLSATTQDGSSVLDKFIIEPVPGQSVGSVYNYRIRTTPGKYFYYGYNGAALNPFTFTIKVMDGSPEIYKTFVTTGNLTNVSPAITTYPSDTVNKATGDLDVFQFVGNNGSNPLGGNSTSDLTWSVTGSAQFTIDSTGMLKTSNSSLEGIFNLVVKLTEASGLFVTTNVTVFYPAIKSISFSTLIYSDVDASYSGTVTITGAGATFAAKATATAASGQSATSNVSVTVGGINRTASASSAGPTTNFSTYFSLPASAIPYSYTISIDVYKSNYMTSADGGLVYTQ